MVRQNKFEKFWRLIFRLLIGIIFLLKLIFKTLYDCSRLFEHKKPLSNLSYQFLNLGLETLAQQPKAKTEAVMEISNSSQRELKRIR